MIEDLARRAAKRVPRFAHAYLEGGTGEETCLSRNREAFSKLELVPRYMAGPFTPDLTTRLLGREYALPFGIAPVGLSSVMWPGMELALAAAAKRANIPYALSSVAAESIEAIATTAPDHAWFQLYPPKDLALRDDLIRRAHDAGNSALLVTADVPTLSRREKMRRSGLQVPPRITLGFLAEILTCPAWTFGTLKRGRPRFLTLEKYATTAELADIAAFVGQQLSNVLDWEYLRQIRSQWDRPLILKGLLHANDVKRAFDEGCDAVVISNHGGRQLDAAPSPVAVLPEIRNTVGPQACLILDSGFRSGLDIVKALAAGADFVLLGRAFLYGVAALGDDGGDHTVAILKEEITNVLGQIGVKSVCKLNANIIQAR